MEEDRLVIEHVMEEQYQGHSTRHSLYLQLEKEVGIPVISYFTSFKYPVMIEDIVEQDIMLHLFPGRLNLRRQ